MCIYVDIYTHTDVFVSTGYILKIGIKGCVIFTSNSHLEIAFPKGFSNSHTH